MIRTDSADNYFFANRKCRKYSSLVQQIRGFEYPNVDRFSNNNLNFIKKTLYNILI
jgi:hypothetical protein